MDGASLRFSSRPNNTHDNVTGGTTQNDPLTDFTVGSRESGLTLTGVAVVAIRTDTVIPTREAGALIDV